MAKPTLSKHIYTNINQLPTPPSLLSMSNQLEVNNHTHFHKKKIVL